jgi:Ca-activated chloride channel homolog
MKKVLNVFIIFLMLMSAVTAQTVRGKVIEGNKNYSAEQYDEALNKYRDAQVHDPESALLKFNIGSAEYKKNKFDEALKEFQGSLSSKDVAMQSQAYYDMGNTLYRSKKLPESILAYQEALKLNPDDADAKYNLEFVRRQLKNQADKQQQNQQNQKQNQQQDQQQQQQQDQQKQDQQQQQQDQQKQDQQQQEQAEKKDQEQQQQQQAEPQEQMSKQDAERVLQAMKENEENLKNARKQQVPGNIRVLKDW